MYIFNKLKETDYNEFLFLRDDAGVEFDGVEKFGGFIGKTMVSLCLKENEWIAIVHFLGDEWIREKLKSKTKSGISDLVVSFVLKHQPDAFTAHERMEIAKYKKAKQGGER